jgi:hypothetical protein
MSPADSAPQKFSHALVERRLGVRAKRMNVFYCLQTAPAPMTLRQLGQASEATADCVASTIELMLELGLAKEVDPIPPRPLSLLQPERTRLCGSPAVAM